MSLPYPSRMTLSRHLNVDYSDHAKKVLLQTGPLVPRELPTLKPLPLADLRGRPETVRSRLARWWHGR